MREAAGRLMGREGRQLTANFEPDSFGTSEVWVGALRAGRQARQATIFLFGM